MTFVKVSCSVCRKKYLKELRRVNEAIKFHWRFFCSSKCYSLGRNKQKTYKCGNPKCIRIFKRLPSDIPKSGICFCSRSCAAIFNNQKSPKRRPRIRECPTCGKAFTGDRKYCILLCMPDRVIPPKEILFSIQEFYKTYNRIPLKKEFIHAKAARLRFGSWNKAILAAGFKPNPVKFARKHIAIDGHKCDSFAEFIIDNWLFTNNIRHKIHVPYFDSKMSSDFSIDNIRIEFIGLAEENRKYDRLLKIKRDMVRKRKLKVIEIYPQDLFPKNNLKKIIRPLLEKTLIE